MRWSRQKRHDKKKSEYKWHTWFAWFPVRLAHSHEYRWLENVLCRREKFGRYTYRDLSYLIAIRVRQECRVGAANDL